MRLEARRRNQQFTRNGSFFLESSETVLKKMPMSTRASSFIPKQFNIIGHNTPNGMMEEVAYAPNNRGGAAVGGHGYGYERQLSNSSMNRISGSRQAVSTRANDPMKVIFPNEEGIETKGEINDISQIVHDISGVEDSSFVMHLDSMDKRLGESKMLINNNSSRAVRQSNICKCHQPAMFLQTTRFH